MKTKKLKWIALGVGLILLVPLAGNMFIDGWNWSLGDFMIFGTMLAMAGLGFEVSSQKLKNPLYRTIAWGAVVSFFMLL